MGNSKPKPPKQPEKTMEEILIEITIQQRTFERMAEKAEKQKEIMIKKAKKSIQQSQCEKAKLQLQNSFAQDAFSKNMMRMAHKLEMLSMTIKTTSTSTVMIEQLNKVTPLLFQQASMFSSEGLYKDYQQFEKSMDELIAIGKVTDGLMQDNNGCNMQSDAVINEMLDQYKKENAQDIGGKLEGNNMQVFNEIRMNNQVDSDPRQISDTKK